MVFLHPWIAPFIFSPFSRRLQSSNPSPLLPPPLRLRPTTGGRRHLRPHPLQGLQAIRETREAAAQEARVFPKALRPRLRPGARHQGDDGEDQEAVRQLRQVRPSLRLRRAPAPDCEGDQRHWGEFITPDVLFLYITGWIGWVGRSYLIAIRDEKKPTQNEIIIDVPLASRLLFRGFSWPVAAYRELLNGELVDPNV